MFTRGKHAPAPAVSRPKKALVSILALAFLLGGASVAAADPPGGGSKPQCVPGGDVSNPHCPSHH
jgi:hypothetical protein